MCLQTVHTCKQALNNLQEMICHKPKQPGPLWPGVVAPDRVLSMGLIEVN